MHTFVCRRMEREEGAHLMMAPELEGPCSSSPCSAAKPPKISLFSTTVSLYQPFQGAKSCTTGSGEKVRGRLRRKPGRGKDDARRG